MSGATATGRGGDPACDQLLCVDGDRSWRIELPARGEIVVGRGADAGLRLADSEVSRAHLRLVISADDLSVTDLGSRHGTQVNGMLVAGSRSVGTGDIIAVGGALLVVRRRARSLVPQTVLSSRVFEQRLDEELARAADRDRELAVVVMGPVDIAGKLDHAALLAMIGDRLTVAESAAALEGGMIAVILPELDEVDAVLRARELLAGASVAAGVAVAPHDAVAADVLMTAARSAATAAKPGAILRASDCVERLALGRHVVLVADPVTTEVYALVRRIARTGVPVQIRGETGSGKELIAAALHAFSPRAQQPFIAINCASIPESLAEAELFGHTRGAFTGAIGTREGQVEAASGGTLFLDEIADLSSTTQARLLRVLECGEVRRLGDNTTRPVDLRVVCASHKDLRAEVAAGRFRQDLYYRLGGALIELPPLRDRPRDLAVLAAAFIKDACARAGRRTLRLSPAAARAIAANPWQGNVRELRHALEYAVATAPDEVRELAPWHLPSAPAGEAVAAPRPLAVATRQWQPIAEELAGLERLRMIEALRASAGVQVKAAELIAMPIRTFGTKVRRHAIEPSEWEDA